MIGIEQSALATLFDSLGTELVKLLGKQATEQWKQFGWDKAAAEYGKKMLCLYDTVRVLGKPEPISLEGLFTDVYILDKPTAFHRFDISQLRADPELLKGEKRQQGLDVVRQVHNNRLFILGKPGAGKTTFLKYLTLQAIKGKIQKIPLFVSLKEWADSQLELMPFLVQQFEICNFPDAQAFVEHILGRGDALVLFDGLDEVQQDGEQRTQIINVLGDFSKQYLSSQCVITCRIAATDYSFEQFTYVEVADFTDKQMQTFVNNWFRKTPKVAENFLTEFSKENHSGLRDLGRTPLLLSLLCLNYEETQTFPARRVEIYEEAIDALLKKWDSSRHIIRR
jgi:predicted NACHT family NTPase